MPLDALVRVSHQEEPDGPYIPGPYTMINDIPDRGINLGPGERLIRELAEDDPLMDSAIGVMVTIVHRTVDLNPRVGKWVVTSEGMHTMLLEKRRWRLEIWTGAGIDGSKPARQSDKRITSPDTVFYFYGDPAPTRFPGADWEAFDAVVATWRHAGDDKDLAERAMAQAVRHALKEDLTTVAALARRIGWSAEYTRLVGLGERLSTEIDSITGLTAEQLSTVDFTAGPDQNSEPDPEQLIAQAMQLLAQARELMRSRD